jgi:hypothetical protein
MHNFLHVHLFYGRRGGQPSPEESRANVAVPCLPRIALVSVRVTRREWRRRRFRLVHSSAPGLR